MVNRQIQVVQITVNAVAIGQKMYLINRKGQRVSRGLRPEEIEGSPEAFITKDWQWKVAITRMKSRLTTRSAMREESAWTRKTKSLAASFRIRRRFRSRPPHARQRFEVYSTHSWEEACKRLWEQGA